MSLLIMTISSQFQWATGLSFYVLAVLFLTRIPYRAMVKRGMEPIRAVYYNRKIVHMLAGGVGSLMVPLVFDSPWFPLVTGLLLTLLTYLAHATGLRMYWFQTDDNRNDVKFALMWACSVSALWWLLDNPWLAILPSLYMAFGDGITGVVRNALIRKRSKSPVGNVFMLLLCAPMGWYIGGLAEPAIPLWGLLSAVVATVIERYEIGPIDDNILITVSASAVLLLGTYWEALPV
jgi:phytol kinase